MAPSPTEEGSLGTWTKGTNLPAQRAETTATVIDGEIYIVGGLDTMGVGGPTLHSLASGLTYDPEADVYAPLPDMPGPRDHPGVATLDGKLYVSGGEDAGGLRDELWRYDPATARWKVLASMPSRRYAHAMVGINGRLYVAGGVIFGARDSRPMDVYDVKTDTWSSKVAPVPTEREHVSGIAVDGRFYLLGGRWITNLTTVEIYDPATDTWTTGPAMSSPRGASTVGLLDGVIHITGGEDINELVTLGSHEGLDVATMTWHPYADLPTRRHGTMSGVVDGKWYVMGGGRAADLSTSNIVEAWSR